jgi:hypothetical protein
VFLIIMSGLFARTSLSVFIPYYYYYYIIICVVIFFTDFATAEENLETLISLPACRRNAVILQCIIGKGKPKFVCIWVLPLYVTAHKTRNVTLMLNGR